MRRMPLIPMAVALAVGIALGHLLPAAGNGMWLAVLTMGSLLGGMVLIVRKSALPSILSLLLIAIIAIGGLRCRMEDPRYDAMQWTYVCQQPSHMTLRLKESPVPRERSWRVEAEVETVDGKPTHGTLNLYLRRDSLAATLRYGDRLQVHGYADTVKRWLYITSDHYLLVGRDSTSLRSRAEQLRAALLRRMQNGPLEKRYAGVAEAMTLGWRGDLEGDLREQFRDAGVMHLLCVSGLHVGLLASMVTGLLFWLGRERRGRVVKGCLTLTVVWIFALFTGLAPATVRAALMFSLFIVSHMMARRTDSLNLLGVAAIVMLMVDPMLLFDTGWQLSFSAVAGILLMRPAISKVSVGVGKAALVSLAATLATLPVTLSAFHQFQPYFLIANILIVPLAAVVLGLSFIYMAVPCDASAWPLEWLLRGFDWLTGGISRLPGAVVEGVSPSPVVTGTIALSVLLLLILTNLYISKKRPWLGPVY